MHDVGADQYPEGQQDVDAEAPAQREEVLGAVGPRAEDADRRAGDACQQQGQREHFDEGRATIHDLLDRLQRAGRLLRRHDAAAPCVD